MKKLLMALSLFSLVSTANADFFGGGNNGEWKMGPYGPYWEENDWPEWTPMYWMQEMSDRFNNDSNSNNGFSFNQGSNAWKMPFFGNNTYGNGLAMMPYGSGYPNPAMPYATAPMPYYGGYPLPNAQMPAMPSLPAAAPINTAPGPSATTGAPTITSPN